MNYKFVLLDIDETVLSFTAAEKFAFDKTHKDNGVEYTAEDFLFYKSINDALWKDFEKGRISAAEISNGRFAKYIKERKINVDHEKFRSDYEENLALNATLMSDDVLPTLAFLKERAKIYAVTNGLTAVQTGRLKLSGIDKYLDGVFISANIGFSKPSAEFFSYVEANIENFDKDEAILVGDSMTADIPAAKFGFHTCLVSPVERDLSAYPVQPEYRISEFSEIKRFYK